MRKFTVEELQEYAAPAKELGEIGIGLVGLEGMTLMLRAIDKYPDMPLKQIVSNVLEILKNTPLWNHFEEVCFL